MKQKSFLQKLSVMDDTLCMVLGLARGYDHGDDGDPVDDEGVGDDCP